jgi:putative ABC transport system permease protein
MQSARIFLNFKIGMQALLTNRFRAILTSLGIIFGVASVIAMLAIGNGAEREILEQIRQVGSNNIIINAKMPEKKNNADQKDGGANNKSKEEKRNVSPGLCMDDVRNIAATLPTINFVSPEIEMNVLILYSGVYKNARLVGITNDFMEASGAKIAEGKMFSFQQADQANSVCIIGKAIKTALFAGRNPIGEYIKCGNNWLQVVGVLDNKHVSEKDINKLSVRDINEDIFLPLPTVLLRYRNRALITAAKMAKHNGGNNDKDNYHQLDRITINVKESSLMGPTLDVLVKMLKRRHGTEDYEIIVPELLLKQEQKTKQLFNIVLAVIASISLIVGGIGIMNIMLASVLERTREIGLRLAVGATKKDVQWQFLSEAVSISVTGGIIGILSGITISILIQKLTGIQTIVSPWSIFISFTISVLVGLVFGSLPARRAAKSDPVVSLRSE